MSLAWSASPRLLIRYSCLGALNAAMPPITVYLGAILVNHIAAIHAHPMRIEDLLPIVIGLWVAVGVQQCMGGYLSYGRQLFVQRIEIEAERRLLQQASALDLGHFDSSDLHDRLARAKRDVAFRPGDLAWSIVVLAGNLVTIGLMGALLAGLNLILIILAVVAAMVSLGLEHRVKSRLYEHFFSETAEERERDYLGNLLVQPRYAGEVRAYVLADYLLKRHYRLSEGLFEKREAIYRLASRSATLKGLLSGTTIALAYFFLVLRAIGGTVNPGAVVLIVGAFTAFSGTLAQISGVLISVDQHTMFLDDYFSFLSIKPLVPRPAQPCALPPSRIDDIEFDNVSFSYPGGGRAAVHGLSLHIRRGELIALVGENGAGKSTLVKLLLRFYDADEGNVRIGGVNLKDLEPETLRGRIGVMFQDYADYQLSIRESIAMGRADLNISEPRVMDALTRSRSGWLLDKFPKGLDSKVGRLFEGGHDLSGGEWQRLALARMIYRDADVWVLDEPTSSLDPEAESAIFAELKEALNGRIGIVISHRFSTVRIADRICVVADGKVIELGTHEELLRAGGRYSQLFELQAVGYR